MMNEFQAAFQVSCADRPADGSEGIYQARLAGNWVIAVGYTRYCRHTDATLPGRDWYLDEICASQEEAEKQLEAKYPCDPEDDYEIWQPIAYSEETAPIVNFSGGTYQIWYENTNTTHCHGKAVYKEQAFYTHGNYESQTRDSLRLWISAEIFKEEANSLADADDFPF